MSKIFYIKIAFENKIKKYAIENINQIKFDQIKSSLGLKQLWKDCLYSYIIVNDFHKPSEDNECEYSETQLKLKLISMRIEQKSTIKLRILQKILMSEEQKRRKQSSDSLEIPTTMQKRRSRSVQIHDAFDEGCKTQVFDITSNFTIQQKNQFNNNYNNYDNNSGAPDNLNSNWIKNKTTQQNKQNVVNKLDISKRQNIKQGQCRRNTLKIPNNCKQQQSLEDSFQDLNQYINKRHQSRSAQIDISSSYQLTQSIHLESDYNQINNCLHQSLKITTRQKSELQKIQEKIKRKQKELQVNEQKIKTSSLFQMLNL